MFSISVHYNSQLMTISSSLVMCTIKVIKVYKEI